MSWRDSIRSRYAALGPDAFPLMPSGLAESNGCFQLGRYRLYCRRRGLRDVDHHRGGNQQTAD
jgi:hypothetical protein